MPALQSQERGGCLTAWIIVALIANALLAFYYLTSSAALQQVYPTISPAIFLLLAAVGVVNVISAIGLWTWHKWGFYLFAATSVVTLVINIGIGLPIVSALLGLVGVGILWYLLRKRWQAFE
ncbi:MAG: hypothetical protein ABI700_28295 [Chloroflexota bacterium]